MRRALLIITLLAVLTPAPLALAAVFVPTESYSTLIVQIDSGQVATAHINPQTRHIKVTLKNGTTQAVAFLAADNKVLVDTLERHGVKPIYSKPVAAVTHPKPPHHVLRYIAAGVVVVLLLIGGGVWVYTRGQQSPAPPDGAEPPSSDAPKKPGGASA